MCRALFHVCIHHIRGGEIVKKSTKKGQKKTALLSTNLYLGVKKAHLLCFLQTTHIQHFTKWQHFQKTQKHAIFD